MEVSLSEVEKFINEQPGLRAFLESNIDIYGKFLYNCTHHCTDHYNIYRNFNIFSPISSFEWAASKEGFNYWCGINDEFRKFRYEL